MIEHLNVDYEFASFTTIEETIAEVTNKLVKDQRLEGSKLARWGSSSKEIFVSSPNNYIDEISIQLQRFSIWTGTGASIMTASSLWSISKMTVPGKWIFYVTSPPVKTKLLLEDICYEGNFNVYEGNHIGEIPESWNITEWRSVPSSMSPADDLIRKLSAPKLYNDHLFYIGLPFLWNSENFWLARSEVIKETSDPNIRAYSWVGLVQRTSSIGY